MSTTTIDFDNVQTVIRQVMRSIASLNVSSYTAGNSDKVEDDVDASFFALDYAMPEVSCLSDTVTRRCAKSEIYSVLDQVVAFRAANPGVAFYHLFDSITAESVMEDIMDMNEDDDDDDAYLEDMFNLISKAA
jgi:hypothetical protein